jgi:hypothetical protein
VKEQGRLDDFAAKGNNFWSDTQSGKPHRKPAKKEENHRTTIIRDF